jgi:hydroxymethylpyrimidine/phosphomethylpyrimidine kinase
VSAKPARILIAAGSDSGGGAGIQADIKTVTALGGFAATAITALTAQNTQGVFGVVGVEPAFIRQQMELVLDDIGADAIKTGMLHDAAVIAVVAEVVVAKAARVPLVVDPVMVAKGGARLIAEDAIGALKTKLISRATVITPNLPEAEVLVGGRIADVAAMKRAAETLRKLGCVAVLLKGGHLVGDVLSDVLASADGIEVFESPRIHSRNTHGTGCTLASAIATGLGQKMSLRDAVIRARAYVRKAIETAPEIGRGHGPLNHGHAIPPFKV